jgi:translation initiation factor 2 beta subunit (eIF-2beta)/eIF-5
VLIENISLIRAMFPGYKIALHANYPLESSIQKLVDMYFYEDLNFIDENKFLILWTKLPYFNKKFSVSVFDCGFSVFQQIKALTKFLIDYKQVILINYDTSVEEIKIETYTENHNLILHRFARMDGYSMIMMSFNPKVFYEKVASRFTIENWKRVDFNDKITEEIFYYIVQESNIKYNLHQDDPPSDKISSDYFHPNVQYNEFFNNYFISFTDGNLELYLWELKKKIDQIFAIDNDGNEYVLKNQISDDVFECVTTLHTEHFTTLQIKKINEIETDLTLQIKKEYKSLPI